ncbi:MAG: glycosyltransferase [Limnohabitans sp.]|nr:glycosyltransferase [Limnohabitans sp.]
MRVLQVIDSLNPGGAERMAVNYANALTKHIEFSGIVVTRKTGELSGNIESDVPVFYLNRKGIFDYTAILNFKRIIKENKIDVLHAHGTSFFIAFMMKLLFWKLKIVFHEHYGGRTDQSFLKNIPLLFSCIFFDTIIVINREVEEWYHKKGVKKASFFPNFAKLNDDGLKETVLNGLPGKRIVCLANLKFPKNHLVLIKAFAKLEDEIKSEWSLHLVGKNYNDNYSYEIIRYISDLGLEKSVYIYDSRFDIENILSQASIGVLCSSFEGFPVTLLEYGLAKLAVISSKVGYCKEIIQNEVTGLLFAPNQIDELAFNIKKLMNDNDLRKSLSVNLNDLVLTNYSEEVVIKKLINLYLK